MTFKTTEKGQALILVAFAAIALFGFAALAIDGSRTFSNKRHAQNAADTAALTAALKYIRTGNNFAAAEIEAKLRASSNGYTDDSATIVDVDRCDHVIDYDGAGHKIPIPGDYDDSGNAIPCAALPVDAKPEEYFRVKIISEIPTTFGRVVGINTLKSAVESVARAVPGYRKSSFQGQSLVMLNQNDCSTFTYGGNGNITVTGSGIFNNSRCTDLSNGAMNSNSSVTHVSVPCYGVVGTKTIGHPDTLVTTGGCANHENDPSLFLAEPMATIPHPDLNCSSLALGTATTTGSTTTITPGRYDSTNTGNSFPASSWAANVVMQPGAYCIDIGSHTFGLSGGQVLNGSNVFIYMKSGGISWTSGTFHLSAMSGVDPLYDGLLLYLAYPGNCQNVSITGNGSSTFVGTILAPCSNVKIAGGSDSGTVGVLENQIIADTISLSGGADLVINYNAAVQWQPPIPPAIEVNE